jgi:hypothetical protein
MIAIQHEGAIKKFTALPKVWTDENGTHLNITDGSSFGFYPVVTPEYNNATQSLGDIEWDADTSVFTCPVIDKVWTQTLDEIKANKITSLKSMYNTELSKTDWYYIRLTALGTEVPQSIIDERAQLNTDCNTHEAAINALKTQAEVAEYQLPSFI